MLCIAIIQGDLYSLFLHIQMSFSVAILKINVQDVMTHVLRGMGKRIDMVIYKLLSLDHHVSINELENAMNNE